MSKRQCVKTEAELDREILVSQLRTLAAANPPRGPCAAMGSTDHAEARNFNRRDRRLQGSSKSARAVASALFPIVAVKAQVNGSDPVSVQPSAAPLRGQRLAIRDRLPWAFGQSKEPVVEIRALHLIGAPGLAEHLPAVPQQFDADRVADGDGSR